MLSHLGSLRPASALPERPLASLRHHSRHGLMALRAGGLKRIELAGEATLTASRGIGMQRALVGIAIERFNRCCKRGLGSGGIFLFNKR